MKRVVFPTYAQAIGKPPLLHRYTLDHPKSLVRVDSVWQEVITPSLYLLNEVGPGNFYIGGHVYLLTEAEATLSGLPPQYLEDA